MAKLKMCDIRGIIIGISISAASCIAIVAGISSLVLAERIGEMGAEVGIHIAVVLASMIGGIFVHKLFDKPLTGCVINTAVLLGLVIITALAIDGDFNSGLLRAIDLAVGSIIACAISLKTGKNKKIKNRRYR